MVGSKRVTKNSKTSVTGAYTYDETNKMVRGVNELGESSAYLYNGLGALVENTWVIKKNAYGYHDVSATTTMVEGEIVVDTTTGSKNKKDKLDPEVVAASPTLNKTSTVVKQFVVDYTSETFEPLMEYEVNGLDYRYVYGNDRLSVNVKGITNGAGKLIENGDQVRLYYHMDLRGTVDYLTSPMSGKVESWTHYNEWGEITHNAVLKCGQRELDMVKRYATHDYDQVLGLYYAKARFYDAATRRFTAMDPILDGSRYDLREYVRTPEQLVQYLYVANNPLIRIDPLGLRYIMENPNTDPVINPNAAQNPVLTLGKTGHDVSRLQDILIRGGYYDASGRDGSFGPTTEAAVKEFQRRNGLAADGSVGPQTWATLTSGTYVRDWATVLNERQQRLNEAKQMELWGYQATVSTLNSQQVRLDNSLQLTQLKALFPDLMKEYNALFTCTEEEFNPFYDGIGDWANNLGKDALAFGKGVWDGQGEWYERARNAENIGEYLYASGNWFTVGTVDGFLTGNTARWDAMLEDFNLYTAANYAGVGIPEMISILTINSFG